MDSRQSTPKTLMATVYLKSQSGRSLLREGKPAPGDATPYLPSPETVEKAITGLQQRGFTIEGRGVTLSISGPPELFEQTCGVKVSFEEVQGREPGQPRPVTRRVYRSSQPVMHIQGLDDLVEGVTFAVPGVPFEERK